MNYTIGAAMPGPLELSARAAILDVVHRYARCLDRLDFDGMISCWHPGGTDNRPPLFRGLAVDFMKWLEPTMRAMIHSTHVISNTVITLKGETAGVESCYTANLRIGRDGRTYDLERNGRYLDRFALRNGVWAIAERHAVTDWSRVREIDPAETAALLPRLLPPGAPQHEPVLPQRDRSDLSYEILGV